MIVCTCEGMEWHSDGSKGECTVLLSLSDIEEEQGSIGVVPYSHTEFIDGIGHGCIDVNKLNDIESRQIRYLYKRHDALVFDARTLHGVKNNISADKWRCVCWFIYDSY